MSLNLLETIQKNAGYTALTKIDPNTAEIKIAADGYNPHNVSQAAIPAVLISMYKYTRTNEGAEEILCGDISTNWLKIFLQNEKGEAIAKVAEYANVSSETASAEMEKIAGEAVKIIRGTNPLTANDVKDLLAAEKDNVLLYLPTTLQMGNLLNDNTLDDSTHKMEGPVSSLMNAIGNIFSGGVVEEEAEKHK